MIQDTEIPSFDEPRKTVEVTGTRNKLDQVFIKADGNWLKGQKIQEEGDRITVRFNAPTAPKGFVVKTVFRDKFERWQREAPKM